MANSKTVTTSTNAHDIFADRLGNLAKKRGETHQSIADKLNIGKDTVDKWFSHGKNATFPRQDIESTLCEILDCDRGYLYGSQPVPRIATATLPDLTGLSEKSAEFLDKNKNQATTLDSLMSHPDFDRLLASVFDFTHCHYANINIFGTCIDIPCVGNLSAHDSFKAAAIQRFSDIIENIYNDNAQIMAFRHDFELLKEMFTLIKQYREVADGFSQKSEKLISYIKRNLALLESETFQVLKNLSPSVIYNNYALIAEKAGIDLEKES